VRVQARRQGRLEITLLRADSGHQEGEFRVSLAQLRHIARIGGSDDQHEIAVVIPIPRRTFGHAPIQRQAVDVEILKILGAGIGGAAEQDGAAIRAREKRQHRILAHVGVHGDGIGAVALEGFARIGLGGIADVAALAVENHQGGRRPFADVADACREFLLRAERAVERDLRLVSGGEIGGRVHDAAIELIDAHGGGPFLEVLRQLRGIRI